MKSALAEFMSGELNFLDKKSEKRPKKLSKAELSFKRPTQKKNSNFAFKRPVSKHISSSSHENNKDFEEFMFSEALQRSSSPLKIGKPTRMSLESGFSSVNTRTSKRKEEKKPKKSIQSEISGFSSEVLTKANYSPVSKVSSAKETLKTPETGGKRKKSRLLKSIQGYHGNFQTKLSRRELESPDKLLRSAKKRQSRAEKELKNQQKRRISKKGRKSRIKSRRSMLRVSRREEDGNFYVEKPHESTPKPSSVNVLQQETPNANTLMEVDLETKEDSFTATLPIAKSPVSNAVSSKEVQETTISFESSDVSSVGMKFDSPPLTLASKDISPHSRRRSNRSNKSEEVEVFETEGKNEKSAKSVYTRDTASVLDEAQSISSVGGFETAQTSLNFNQMSPEKVQEEVVETESPVEVIKKSKKKRKSVESEAIVVFDGVVEEEEEKEEVLLINDGKDRVVEPKEVKMMTPHRRRSKRRKWRPLNYWKGERIVYSRNIAKDIRIKGAAKTLLCSSPQLPNLNRHKKSRKALKSTKLQPYSLPSHLDLEEADEDLEIFDEETSETRMISFKKEFERSASNWRRYSLRDVEGWKQLLEDYPPLDVTEKEALKKPLHVLVEFVSPDRSVRVGKIRIGCRSVKLMEETGDSEYKIRVESCQRNSLVFRTKEGDQIVQEDTLITIPPGTLYGFENLSEKVDVFLSFQVAEVE